MTPTLQQRKAAFVQLGHICGTVATKKTWPGFDSGLTEGEFHSMLDLIEKQVFSNGWFTPENVKMALLSWSEAMTSDQMDQWTKEYQLKLEPTKPKQIAIICAGNIPLVGWHDILTVLLSGHQAIIKLSSDDNLLIPALLQILSRLEPNFGDKYTFLNGKLEGYEAVIATGSNNTARYFNYYFKHVPHIIRRNRTSVSIINGTESELELKNLAKDIFFYFGLGCRNVSKVYLPEGFDINKLFNAMYDFHPIVNHNKYANNYDYNKAVWLLNQEDLLDNGFILLKNDTSLAAPTASLYYEYYADQTEIKQHLQSKSSEIQCIIGHGEIPFGTSQKPQLWDYADGVNTLDFLCSLK